MKTPRRRTIFRGAFGLALLVVGFAGSRALLRLQEPPERNVQQAPLRHVGVLPMRRVDHVEWIAAFGRAHAVRRATVSAEVAGRIAALDDGLAPGRWVEQNEVLLELDPQDLQRTRDGIEVDLDRAVRDEDAARRALSALNDRVEGLRQEREVADREYRRIRALADESLEHEQSADAKWRMVAALDSRLLELAAQRPDREAAVERAALEHRSLELRLAQADADLDRCTARSPIRGVIVHRAVETGARVNIGTTLFELEDPSEVEVAVSLAARHFPDVEPGAELQLYTARGGPASWSGSVLRKDSGVDPSERSFQVYARVRRSMPGLPGPNPEPEQVAVAGTLPPGSFVHAEVRGTTSEGVYAVPRVAFVRDRLYVAVPEQTTEPPPAGATSIAVVEERVPRVRRWLADVVLVDEGLADGELLVVSQLENVAPGARVRTTAVRESAQ